jgi:hypothetical protein
MLIAFLLVDCFYFFTEKDLPNIDMLPATWKKNDRKATILIVWFLLSFLPRFSIGRVTLNVNLGFDPHIFAKANALSIQS